jgi:hypothetical protein
MTVNFTNILCAAFSYQSSLHSLYVLTIWVSNFWRKDFGAKAAHKMLVKLTPGKQTNTLDEQTNTLGEQTNTLDEQTNTLAYYRVHT